MWGTLPTAVFVMGGLGVVFTLGLYAIARWEGDRSDDQVELLSNMLPGNNCGACGMAGCAAMARALAEGEATPQACPVASNEQIEVLSKALGITTQDERTRQVARVHCGGTLAIAPQRAIYEGVLDCRAADLVGKGSKGCIYGCLGLGTCVRACPFGAIVLGEDGLPQIDEDLCTGCGLCALACPRNVIQMQDANQRVWVQCVSCAPGKRVRSVCQTGCIACNICVRTCEQDAIQMVNGLAVIDPAKCTACGDCVEVCPTGAIISILGERATTAVSQNGSREEVAV